MALEVGQSLPGNTIFTMKDGKVAETSLEEWAKGRKVVLIAVPGAFTPTCAVKHLPGYVDNAKAFFDKGVEAIGCIAVNDVFVMSAWGKSSGCDGKVDMLADPAGDASGAMGIATVDNPVLGKGRAARLALVAEDGVVTKLYIEKPSAFEVSSAEAVLSNI